MIVYHGTTDRRARRICQEGFQPRKPSRRVWFAESRGYAERRAKQQARRRHDRAAVLTCEFTIDQMQRFLGARRVFRRNGVIALDGAVPVTVLRSHPGLEAPCSPEELAAWVNDVLGLKPHKGVGRRHPGIARLSRWVMNRVSSQPDSRLSQGELLHMARQWLGEFFKDVEVDPDRLGARRTMQQIDVFPAGEPPEPDPREQEALDCLQQTSPRCRVRGLKLLEGLDDPDLFEWSVMMLEDESPAVKVAALRTMACCREGDAETIAPFAASGDKRIRAAAIAALARHADDDAARWFERGLKDPSACVRMSTAALMDRLNPVEHRTLFELALHDPNPQVARTARKLTAGKGYSKASW
ncbi:MAG TPA: hypothetical protein VMZ31_01950 [Phycisphaerae bacterium]|nr:hypothetical protein [Phycisphaerae bacterium]